VIASNQNAQVIAILMDVEKFNNGNVTSNANHVLNPRRVSNLNAKFAADNNSQGLAMTANTAIRGQFLRDFNGHQSQRSGPDHLYTRTGFRLIRSDSARNPPARKGYYGLFNPTGGTDLFEYNGKYMIWSLG